MSPSKSQLESTINETTSNSEDTTLSTPRQGMTQDLLKYFSLISLTLQNALLILVMRYVRTREGEMFMATTAVIVSEVLKFTACLMIILYQEGNIKCFMQRLNEDILKQPIDCLKVSIPSLIYTLQNNLLYIAVSNLDAATFQVTYQLKILTTAIFSVLMLKKQLGKLQWVALCFLFVGVSIVQMQPDTGTNNPQKVAIDQSPVKGLVAVIISCLMSGFAGVYFEKILKGTHQSVWLRNVQLGVIGSVIGTVTMLIKDGDKVKENGFFYGYDGVVLFVVCLQSFGGLLVAVVVKYADNILKGFATSAAIVISCIASMYFFDFHLSVQFVVGATAVMFAVYMYSKYVPTPNKSTTSA